MRVLRLLSLRCTDLSAACPTQAASASATPASLASLDSLMEGLLRTAGLLAKIQTLRWALSLRAQILGQVGLPRDHFE